MRCAGTMHVVAFVKSAVKKQDRTLFMLSEASLSFRYIAPTTRTAKSSILTPKIAKIPFAETG